MGEETRPDSMFVARVALWTTATGLAARALSLVGTVLLAWLVKPEQMAEVTNASVLVLTAGQVSTLGVGAYVIAFPRSGRAVAFHATVVHVLLGALALAFALAFRDLFAGFAAPALGRFVPGLALAALVDRVTFMAERPAARDLKFRRISASRTLGELTYAAVSVLTAWRGAGAMAVVWGNLARSAVRLTVMLATTDRREWLEPVRLSWQTFRLLGSYGVVAAVESMASASARRWDNPLVTHYFGETIGGRYIYAYNLADMPAIQVGEQISEVLFASYARLEPARRPAALLRAAALTTMVMAPLSFGLGAVAQTIVPTFFASTWMGMVPLLEVLSAAIVFRPIGSVFAAYLQVRSGPKPCAVIEVVTLGLLVGLIVLVGNLGGGPLMVCWMVGVAFAVRALLFMWAVQRVGDVRVTACLARVVPVLLACGPLVLIVHLVRRAMSGACPIGVRLACEMLAGGLAYALAAFVLAPRAWLDLAKLLRQTLRRR